MEKAKYYLKAANAIFKSISFDVAIGIIVTHVLVLIFGHYPGTYTVYIFGIFMALLPDIDTLFMIRKDRFYADHRSWPHYPVLMFLIVLPAVSLWSYLYFAYVSDFYLLLAGSCLFWHYLHDSWDNIENEEGIQWGAPFFSYNRYVISVRPLADDKKSWFVITRAFVRRVTNKTLKRIKAKQETAIEFWEKHYMKETLEAYQGVIVLLMAILFVWVV